MPQSNPPTGAHPASGPSQGSPQGSSQGLLEQAGHQTQESEFFNPIPPGYVRGRHKYVVVLGTVMSGLGKGIFSSSLAKLLKDKGLRVAPIKMEGYLNIDSGTLNPYRHGEVFVLDDGLETDMDLGTYERMLDQDLTRDNYTTSGQIYQKVLDKERSGGYLGRDVQMIPHVTGEVKYKLRELAVKQHADVVFVEVGGTVGDHENAFYIEALRQLAFEEGPGSVCYVALTYIIEPPALGEQKSKAAQLGLKKLMEAGIQPHLIACRCQNPVEQGAKEKVAMFSNVPVERVFSMHDRPSIYTIPTEMRDAGVDRHILTLLKLHERVNVQHEDRERERWLKFVRKVTAPRRHKARIGVTGKYASLRDAYASIDKAIEHCAAAINADIDLVWIDVTKEGAAPLTRQLESVNGVIVPGGFGHRGTENKIACVRHCRENKLPYLGICLGFQMAVIEFARHVCGIKQAVSSEFAPEGQHRVIDILPEQKKIEGLGGNMRLGGKDVLIKPSTLAASLYYNTRAGKHDRHQPFTIRERFRHRFEVDPAYIGQLESHGLVFSGRHPEQPIMQVLELPQTGAPEDAATLAETNPYFRDHGGHPYFIGAQFHPELISRPLDPAPMFMGMVAAAVQHASPDTPAKDIAERWLPDPKKDRPVTV
ncbi:MAG: CTP synthase [Phycisphaeraceae bacterium]